MAKQLEWTLTGEALQKLLLSLDPDVQRAGEIYETIRLTLIKFFDWRGVHFPEECADETFNRIMRKLEAGETIIDVKTYCHGVARFVLLESLKNPNIKARIWKICRHWLPRLRKNLPRIIGWNVFGNAFKPCRQRRNN